MDLTQIIAIADTIWKTLGPGFSESVYHNAFEVELRALGIPYETERIIPIIYNNHVVGSVRADLIINNETVIELKSVLKLNESHRHQVGIYMDHGPFQTGVLINFPSGQSASVEYQTFTSSSR